MLFSIYFTCHDFRYNCIHRLLMLMIMFLCQSVVDSRVFMTIAVDMVIEGIQEPVRFIIETRAKIFPSNERFWYFSTKPLVEQFILKLKEVVLNVCFQICIYGVRICTSGV